MTIVAQWIDNMLVHPFKYNDLFAVNVIRMRGDHLEEKKLTVENKLCYRRRYINASTYYSTPKNESSI